MKEIVERLHENRQVAIAKEILESNGYKVSKRVVESIKGETKTNERIPIIEEALKEVDLSGFKDVECYSPLTFHGYMSTVVNAIDEELGCSVPLFAISHSKRKVDKDIIKKSLNKSLRNLNSFRPIVSSVITKFKKEFPDVDFEVLRYGTIGPVNSYASADELLVSINGERLFLDGEDNLRVLASATDFKSALIDVLPNTNTIKYNNDLLPKVLHDLGIDTSEGV